MSDPHETLAHIRAQAGAATEGPWEWAGKQVESFPQGENSLIVQGDPEREVIGSWGHDAWGVDVENPADAEFIAAARTTVPALVDALEAVLAIHRDGGESQGYLDNGHYGVIDHCCTECGSHGEYGTPWPCPTVKAVADALGGGTDAPR